MVEFNKNENSYTLYVDISENITLSTTFFENFRASFESLQIKFVTLAKESFEDPQNKISFRRACAVSLHSDSSKTKKTSISRVVLGNLLNRIWTQNLPKARDLAKYRRLSIKRFR